MGQGQGTGGVGGSWEDVLRDHTDPPSARSRQLAVCLGAVQLAVCAGLALGGDTFLAAVLALLGVANGVRWWRSGRGSSTTASGDGLLVRAGDEPEHLPWELVQEVRVRRPWARWSTATTTARWPVALPGVSDAAAVRLEQLRAHLGAGRGD